MNTIIEMLNEFHTRPGVDVGTPDGASIDVPGLQDRQAFLEEELRELRAALVTQDVVEFADALGDMKYVVYGTAWRAGVDLNTTSTVHAGGSPNAPTLDVDGVRLQVGSLGGRVRQLATALRAHDLDQFAYLLEKIDQALESIAYRTGIPLLEVVAEIHASNMTKTASPGDGKAIKGPDYRRPDVAGVLRRKTQHA